jgi:hypothetical protein
MLRAAVRCRPQIARTPQPFTILSRSQLLLANGFSANSSVVIVVSQIIQNPQDGFFYLLYGAQAAATSQWGLAKGSSLAGPWTDQGALPGVPTNTMVWQARLILGPDNKWSLYYVTATNGTIGLYQTVAAGAITSAYTVTNAALLAHGAAGSFDEQRCSEPHIFKDQGGVWRLLYMGMNAGLTAEQLGMATSSGDHTGPFTKVATTPIIANGALATFDAAVVADPSVIYYGGVYYIFYACAWANGATGSGIDMMACATTTDFVTFTKRGMFFPVAQAWGPDSENAWAGSFWWPGIEAAGYTYALPKSISDIYYTYGGRSLSQGNAGAGAQAYLAQFDPQSIFGGALLAGTPWARVEAETAGGSQVKVGTWTIVSANTRGYSNQGFVFSPNANDSIAFTWTGKRCRVFCTCANVDGIANVLLDNVQVGTYDGGRNAANESLNGVTIAWDTGDLMQGSHTLKLVVTGTHNATATAANVGVDCWDFI